MELSELKATFESLYGNVSPIVDEISPEYVPAISRFDITIRDRNFFNPNPSVITLEVPARCEWKFGSTPNGTRISHPYLGVFKFRKRKGLYTVSLQIPDVKTSHERLKSKEWIFSIKMRHPVKRDSTLSLRERINDYDVENLTFDPENDHVEVDRTYRYINATVGKAYIEIHRNLEVYPFELDEVTRDTAQFALNNLYLRKFIVMFR